jgi:hypothetical protein
MSDGKDKGKGKGRAGAVDDIGTPQHALSGSSAAENSDSLLSRIGASASGLAQSTFATPNSHELNDRTAAALANAGKAQGSGASGGTAWAESSRSVPQPSPQLHEAHRIFRSDHTESHMAQAESEFSTFLDSIPSFQPSTDDGIDVVEQSRVIAPSQESSHQHLPIAEQEQRDGQDVLALLSQPSTEVAPPSLPVDEEVNWNLSPEQMDILRDLTKDLFPPAEAHNPMPADHPLNLIPDIGAPTRSSHLPYHDEQSDESSMYFGRNLQTEDARDLWMEHWREVLDRYQDKVWGNLLPLVQEAFDEVQAAKNSDGPTEPPKALRRLGLILGHLKA